MIRTILLALLLLLPLSTVANTTDELILKAQNAFVQKQYSTSLIYLKNAAKNDPGNLKIHLELIKAFIFTGQGVQAQTEVNKAKRLNASPKEIAILEAKTQFLIGEFDAITNGFNFIDLPQKDIARIRAIQGDAFFEKREFKQARLMYQRAFLLSPKEFEVELGQVRLYKIDGNKEQEKLLIESLLQRYPEHPEVMLRAGQYYLANHHFEKALSLFDAAGKIQPSNVNVWFGSVRSYIGQKNYQQAKNEIQKVLTNYPEHQVGNYLLAVIAFEEKDYTRAKSAIDIVLKGKKRNFEALKLLGTIQFHLNDYSSAERNLLKFLQYNPEDIQAKKTISAIYLKRKQNTLAINLLKQIEHTNDPFVFSMMATAYQYMENTTKSDLYFKKALTLAPDNTQIQKQYQLAQLQTGKTIALDFNDFEYTDFSGQGRLYVLNLLNTKKYDEARKILNNYLKKSPQSALLYYFLATASLYKNDTKQAKIEFQRSISLNNKLIESKINLAKIYTRENNDREAEKLYREVLKIQPHNDQALVSLAGIFHRKGDEGKMLKWLNKSRQHNTASLASREVLIDFYMRKNNISKVLDISKEMIAIQPENISLLVKHAEYLKRSGRPDLSVQVYKKIIQLKPDAAASWFGLGKMESFDADFENSYKSFEKALSLAPKSLIIRVLLTQYDLQNKDFEKALQRARELVKTHPQKAPSYDTLGDVYIALKNPAEAIKHYNKSVALSYNSETYAKLFSAYNLNNQTTLGIKKLQQWIKKFPQDLNLKEILAITYQRQGKYQQAQKLYRDIIKKERNSDRVFNNLALVSLQLNSPMSMEYADMAYNINANNAANLDTLGWVHFNNNNLNEALNYLSQAVKKAPENPDIRYHYAVALSKAKRINEAKTQLALIIEIEGKFKNRDKAKALFKQLHQP